jgi:hypothetical protein
LNKGRIVALDQHERTLIFRSSGRLKKTNYSAGVEIHGMLSQGLLNRSSCCSDTALIVEAPRSGNYLKRSTSFVTTRTGIIRAFPEQIFLPASGEINLKLNAFIGTYEA